MEATCGSARPTWDLLLLLHFVEVALPHSERDSRSRVVPQRKGSHCTIDGGSCWEKLMHPSRADHVVSPRSDLVVRRPVSELVPGELVDAGNDHPLGVDAQAAESGDSTKL